MDDIPILPHRQGGSQCFLQAIHGFIIFGLAQVTGTYKNALEA
jgi:hypothetical protein